MISIKRIIQATKESKYLNPSPLRFDNHGLFTHGKVWRSDTRSPVELMQANGFQASGSNDNLGNNLQMHVRAYTRSAYIGFGKTALDAMKFCRPVSFKMKPPFIRVGSYLYKTNEPKIYVDVRNSCSMYYSAPDRFLGRNWGEVENEIAAYQSMPYTDIHKARRYIALPEFGIPFCFIGELYHNPHYQPRDWAIRIPSASSEEADYLENQSRGTTLLREGQRFIRLNEAEEMSAALQKESLKYTLPNNDPNIYVFDKLPINIDSKQSVDYVVKEYHKHEQIYVDPSKWFSYFYFSKPKYNSADAIKDIDSSNVAKKMP